MTTATEQSAVVLSMDEAAYHAHPALSSTGARRILSSPARFRYELEHPVEKAAFDLGKAVHAKVLGTGAQVVAIPEALLSSNGAASTKEAKAFIAEARLAGQVPLKADVVAQVNAMAEAVLAHRTARAGFEQPGHPEVSLFAIDAATGVGLRARPDFLPDQGERRTIAADLKTSRSADPRLFRRSAADFGYHQQYAFYVDVLRQARGDRDAALVFVIVEPEPPYLVSVCELIDEAIAVGRARNRTAIDLYARCLAADEWPGYGDEVHAIDLPVWAMNELETVL
jgi:hypothetical protein